MNLLFMNLIASDDNPWDFGDKFEPEGGCNFVAILKVGRVPILGLYNRAVGRESNRTSDRVMEAQPWEANTWTGTGEGEPCVSWWWRDIK